MDAPAISLFDDDDDDGGAADLFFEESEHERSVTLAHQNLIDTQERIGQLLDLLPIGLVIHQRQSVLFANQHTTDMVGVSSEALVGQHIMDFVHDDDFDDAQAAFARTFEEDGPQRLPEVRVKGKDGRIWITELIMGRLPWEGTPCVQVLIHDVTALKQQEAQLRELATTDPLTGALNRRSFEDHARVELDRARRYNRNCSLILLDIDHFKKVNDTWGHHAGDVAIKMVVDITQSCLRTADVVGATQDLLVATADLATDPSPAAEVSRMGGEEFLVLLPETDAAGAFVVAERIREQVAATPVVTEEQTFSITVSLGVSVLTADDDLENFIKRADAGLYEAKEGGRNQTRVGTTLGSAPAQPAS